MAKVVLHFLVPHVDGGVLSALNPGLSNGSGGTYSLKGAICNPSLPLPPAVFGPMQQEYGFTGESTAVSCEECMKHPEFRKDYRKQTGIDLDAQEAAAKAIEEPELKINTDEVTTTTE